MHLMAVSQPGMGGCGKQHPPANPQGDLQDVNLAGSLEAVFVCCKCSLELLSVELPYQMRKAAATLQLMQPTWDHEGGRNESFGLIMIARLLPMTPALDTGVI